MDAAAYRVDVESQFRKLKANADRALAQVSDADLFRALGDDENSIAIIVKHMAGNMRSRWRDFLTSDGEKADRHRDTEFELTEADDRTALLRRWDEGWTHLFQAIVPLRPTELEATVTIRGEPHTVVQALQRQLGHYSYHVGQIVLLARHFAGDRWQTLSIAKGASADFNRAPQPYIDHREA